MSIVVKLKSLSRNQLAALFFYTSTGILLWASLPFTRFPPHIGFLGIINFISAYSLLTKRAWAPWLMFILLVTNTVFSLYTLYYAGLSNILLALCAFIYAVFTWIISALMLLKRKN
ncbi:MAG: hypothetical protein LBQ98_10585 [Nitrososphaerota archaeon]|nr:hypothetical protein [Nitrososphaerota archaeon]